MQSKNDKACFVLSFLKRIKRKTGARHDRKQLPIVVEAERGWAVGQEAAVFEPVHHGNREAADSAVHGHLSCQSNGDVVWTTDYVKSFRNSCHAAH